MADHTCHTFVFTWDAPLDEVRCSYRFIAGSPATGPDRWGPGEPADPDEVEVDPRTVTVRVGTGWHDAPWLADWIVEQYYHDMCELAAAERVEGRAPNRRAA